MNVAVLIMDKHFQRLDCNRERDNGAGISIEIVVGASTSLVAFS